MKTNRFLISLLLLALAGCVNEYNKPWVAKADSLVGRNFRTACEMVVVAEGSRYLLVPVSDDTRRFREASEDRRVVASVPIGSEGRMKKRTFEVSKPGRDDYVVVDLVTNSGMRSNVLLIVGSAFLEDANFREI